MKIQALIFAVLHAQTVLSAPGAGDGRIEVGADLPDCAKPCKTQLRAGAAKMEECLKTNCGAQAAARKNESSADVEEGSDVHTIPRIRSFDEVMPVFEEDELSGNRNSCVARCKRLRFGPSRQKQCIKDCDDEGESREMDGEDESQQMDGEDNHRSPGNYNSCVARCKRLRFSPRMQEQCTEECSEDSRTLYAAATS